MPVDSNFFDHIPHIPGGQKLPLFHIDHLPRGGDRQDEIRLPAKKGGNLQNIEDRRRRRHLLETVDIRKHREFRTPS